MIQEKELEETMEIVLDDFMEAIQKRHSGDSLYSESVLQNFENKLAKLHLDDKHFYCLEEEIQQLVEKRLLREAEINDLLDAND